MVVSVGFSWEECTESETEFAGNPNVWNNFKRLLLVIFFNLNVLWWFHCFVEKL